MNNKIRRINIFSGPGGGKSITANNVKAQLGFNNYNIELVEEVVKEWTYINRSPKNCDSYYLQACQIQKEDIRLRSGVDLIVSDSPVFLQYFYAYYHEDPLSLSMHKAFLEFEAMYPSINIFVEREIDFYTEVGRYEKIEEAKKIDNLIKGMMVKNCISFISFSCLKQNEIINYILSKLEKINE